MEEEFPGARLAQGKDLAARATPENDTPGALLVDLAAEVVGAPRSKRWSRRDPERDQAGRGHDLPASTRLLRGAPCPVLAAARLKAHPLLRAEGCPTVPANHTTRICAFYE